LAKKYPKEFLGYLSIIVYEGYVVLRLYIGAAPLVFAGVVVVSRDEFDHVTMIVEYIVGVSYINAVCVEEHPSNRLHESSIQLEVEFVKESSVVVPIVQGEHSEELWGHSEIYSQVLVVQVVL
jgi:hypothetical protein